MFKKRLLVENSFGRDWVPFKFINLHPEWVVENDSREIILAGPNHKKFENAWSEILKTAKFLEADGTTHKLEQTFDGDLYAVVTK